ncbi:MAG: MCP four helix bundle domain-containing protein [Rhodospirillaceae bacterium]
MTNLTIRLKLRIIFLFLAGLFLLFGLLSLSRLGVLTSQLEMLERDTLPAILSTNTINTELGDFRVQEGLHILTRDLAAKETIEKSMIAQLDQIAKTTAILEPLIVDTESKVLYHNYTTLYAKYLDEHRKIISVSSLNDLDNARQIYVEAAPVFKQLTTVIDRLVTLEREEALAEIKGARDLFAHRKIRTMFVGFVLFTFIVGCVALLERTVSQSIQTLADQITQIGAGNLAVVISGQERGDEVGQIARAVASTVFTIHQTVKELNRLIGEIQTGHLAERVDPQAFQGEFFTLLTGANALVETLARPLIEVAAVMQKLASGKLDGRMTGAYEGDLRALKANVNRSLDTLTRLLGELATTAHHMAAADLHHGIAGSYQGSFAEVRADVNRALSQLRYLVSEASRGTEQSAAAAAGAAAAAHQVAASTARQVCALNEMVVAIQETAASISSVAVHAVNGGTMAETASRLASSGRSELSALTAEVGRLAARHGRIEQITSAIAGIADKATVLSINVAIEASRGGAESRGFSVVAHRIGRLAEEAAHAAGEIGAIIAEAREGVEISAAGGANAEAAMARIGSAIEQSGTTAQVIATAIAQQSAAIQLVSQRLEEFGLEGNNNASAAEEISVTMEELLRIVNNTRAEVSRFTLE